MLAIDMQSRNELLQTHINFQSPIYCSRAGVLPVAAVQSV